jgi:hypothetical protein
MYCYSQANHATSDEENGAIFDFAKEAALSHAPTDNLDSLKLSMQPDRVVGLRSPVRIPYDASLFPVTGRGILLPFLVVEAKKEHNAPGFRAIQCQTAFVIRRLLMAQDSLLKQFPSSEPPLVWFFAFQGEQWRLQICTYDDSKAPVVSFLHTSQFHLIDWDVRNSTTRGKAQSNAKTTPCNFC